MTWKQRLRQKAKVIGIYFTLASAVIGTIVGWRTLREPDAADLRGSIACDENTLRSIKHHLERLGGPGNE